ncbi:A disintegrin and metalloproteinase with thrombospondin motifs 6-like [Pecten maximus]|uniref:A disintegrin and metalloproteinase with thrombospondin motifs 6-like n=1 Tax=Pecten maximus TaxID=6579 RepID=UPI001458DAE0|nr:A disintegrin and metalloproteinase with thrombospondin motifs 6-like [Pecten maximus]
MYINLAMDMCKPNRCVTGRSCIYSCVRHGNLLKESCDQAMDNSNPLHCDNGTICTHQCICTGNYFGTYCENLNGGFSNWSSYGSCSRECGNGTKTRTRTCNNPTPVGNGSACTGNTSEIVPCNSHPCPTACSSSSESLNCTCKNTMVNMTSDELVDIIDKLKLELKIDKTKTSMAIRRKTSANDSRTSAKMLGVLGAVMLAVPFVLIALSDLSNVYRYNIADTSKIRTVTPV